MIVLGIESSCDETAAALVDDSRRLRANLVLSQFEEHRRFGGVVPEIAARSHLDHLDGLIAQAMKDAGLGFGDLAGIAATCGPGLIGGLMVGAVTGKAIAAVYGLPFVAVNHLEGHALTPRLTDDLPFPYLLLLVSGGHCQLLSVEGIGRYRKLGGTVDDAIGEAFDKTAKLLDLGYPGGPALESMAMDGAPGRFELPRPMLGRPGCDFSFSGLKTAMRHSAEDLPYPLSERDKADLAVAFQEAVGDVLVDRCRHGLARFREMTDCNGPLVIAGGVAANRALRGRLEKLAQERDIRLIAPPPKLCTDNAAVIAWAGLERLRLGADDPLTTPARPRWPLDRLTPPSSQDSTAEKAAP